MKNKNERSFVTKNGKVVARISDEKLFSSTNNIKNNTDRKFNIRIKHDDLHLLDSLANANGVTRSNLINYLIHQILIAELMSVEERDSRVLLARAADQLASYDELLQPWIYDALGDEVRDIADSLVKYGNPYGQPPEVSMPDMQYSEEDYRSPVFIGLRNKLKEVLK